MSSNLYELLALAARYFFAGLMLLIVIRAWRMTLVDSRRASKLRRLAPVTGLSGEFLVVGGDGRVRDGMRYPVIREGLIGSSAKADIRLRSPSVRRAHARFELTAKGLKISASGRARVYDETGAARRELLLPDGARVTFGEVELLLILTQAVGAAKPEEDELFRVSPARRAPGSVSPEPPIRREIPREDPADRWLDETVDEPSDDPFAIAPDLPPARPREVPRPAPRRVEPDITLYPPVRRPPQPRVRPAAPRTVQPEADEWLVGTGSLSPESKHSCADEWDDSPKKRPSKPTGGDDLFDV